MVALHFIPEYLTGTAYLAIVIALLILATKRSDLVYGWHLWLFTIFILVCSLGELRDIRSLAPEAGREQDAVEILKAALAVAALAALPSLVQRLVRLPSPVDLRNALKRLRVAKAEAMQANRWLSLGEEVGHVGHWRAERSGNVIKCSKEVYRILGWPADGSEVTIDRLRSALLPRDWRKVIVAIGRASATQNRFELQTPLVRVDRKTRHVLLRGIVQAGEDAEVVSLFGVIVDQTEQKLVEVELFKARAVAEAANARLEALALRDVLTGLANRRHFDATLTDEIRRAKRIGIELALLIIEIDEFDQYADSFGRWAGERCLITISAAIERSLHRAGDLAALYEEHKFTVLLPNSNEAGAMIVAAHILDAVRDLKIPCKPDGSGIVTVSIGATAVDCSSATRNPLSAIGLALGACEMAKRQGQNQACPASLQGATRTDIRLSAR